MWVGFRHHSSHGYREYMLCNKLPLRLLKTLFTEGGYMLCFQVQHLV